MSTHSQMNCHRVEHADDFFVQQGYTRVPQLVQWMATLRCGLKCEHCLAAGEKAKLADMPLTMTKAMIDEIAGLGVREFLVTGGEPLVREDLAEVIDYLGHRQVNWTLNTAAFPDKELREAIARHKPGFVAVSLDGPAAVHDGFRGKAGAYQEALESIVFFKSLGVRVCAGTTVTTKNYDYLSDTFHLAVSSGADQWGIHLLVPEGRAAERKDLFLSRTQLKRLIKFVARKRQSFNVQMADEIGYLGLMEPLVRDVPLTCGAGRSQCVILPDGSVVPCTTLDRSTRAGNLFERSLQAIWSEGFAELRSWRPQGKCGQCDYSMACKGGCWLQRRAGTECFKDVWHVPGALKTAAGIAICLGGMAAVENPALGQGLPAMDDLETSANYAAVSSTQQTTNLLALDTAILQGYAAWADQESWDVNSVSGANGGDPGWAFFRDFWQGTLPKNLVDRCARIHSALTTEQRSLSLASLCYRVLEEPILDTNETLSYDTNNRQLIRETLAAIQSTAKNWRQEIYTDSLDPYLRNGRYVQPPYCSMSKAGGPSFQMSTGLLKDLNIERWGIGSDFDCMSAVEAFMNEHPLGDQMSLHFSFFTRGELTRYTAKGPQQIRSHIDNYCTGEHSIGLFDVIKAQQDTVIDFKINGTADVCGEFPQDMLLNDAPREVSFRAVPCYLEAGHEYTYAEILRKVYHSQRDLLMELACAWLSDHDIYIGDSSPYSVVSIHQNGALLWPAMRDIIREDTVSFQWQHQSVNTQETVITNQNTTIHQRAMMKDVDFWMF